jgi:hypothetical protein
MMNRRKAAGDYRWLKELEREARAELGRVLKVDEGNALGA